MRRPRFLLGMLLVGGLAGCGEAAQEPLPPARAAEPQAVELGWRESYPPRGLRLVFGVERLEVTTEGWSAVVSIQNETRIRFELGKRPLQLAFGLMLFDDGSLAALEEASRSGELPALRSADEIVPPPPPVLAPGQSWHATISARGSLADDAYVRVTFGTLVATGETPEEFPANLVWITDKAYRL